MSVDGRSQAVTPRKDRFVAPVFVEHAAGRGKRIDADVPAIVLTVRKQLAAPHRRGPPRKVVSSLL